MRTHPSRQLYESHTTRTHSCHVSRSRNRFSRNAAQVTMSNWWYHLGGEIRWSLTDTTQRKHSERNGTETLRIIVVVVLSRWLHHGVCCNKCSASVIEREDLESDVVGLQEVRVRSSDGRCLVDNRCHGNDRKWYRREGSRWPHV